MILIIINVWYWIWCCKWLIFIKIWRRLRLCVKRWRRQFIFVVYSLQLPQKNVIQPNNTNKQKTLQLFSVEVVDNRLRSHRWSSFNVAIVGKCLVFSTKFGLDCNENCNGSLSNIIIAIIPVDMRKRRALARNSCVKEIDSNILKKWCVVN
jgi:hypothetical protein